MLVIHISQFELSANTVILEGVAGLPIERILDQAFAAFQHGDYGPSACTKDLFIIPSLNQTWQIKSVGFSLLSDHEVHGHVQVMHEVS